ncbi:MAG: hypothetical protein QXP57_08810 [Nitrososphaerota archaeon]
MVVEILKLVRTYLVEIVIFIVFLAVILSSIYWLGKELPQAVATTIPAIVTAIGVLLANRIHYKMQLPELSIKWNYLLFKQERSIRVFIEVRNKEGRRIAQDVKAMISIKKLSEDGKEKDLEEEDLLDPKGYNVLAPRETPSIENDLIPWMVPETSPGATGLDGIHLKHITNISPGQINRAPLFDIKLIGSKDNLDYIIIVFSEYGTEVETIPGTGGKRRYVRCILRKGRYKFRIRVTAGEAIPAEGELLIDEWAIFFKKPPQEKLDIRAKLAG